MKKLSIGICIVFTGIVAAFFSYTQRSSHATGWDKPQYIDTSAERGKYLVSILGCADCHSPKMMTPQGPQPNPDLHLSGHPAGERIGKVDTSSLRDWTLFNFHNTAVVGPWGVSYAANITSDETGIGNWTEQQFLTAMKKGKFKGLETGRPLLPPMPWFNYANATDSDLKAIFRYLKTTKPVANVVPQPQPLQQLEKVNRID